MWAEIAPFLAACLVIELTPGPNMAYLALLSARHGRLAGYVASVGVGLGLLTIGLLAAFGFGQFVQGTPWLYRSCGGQAWRICSISRGTAGAMCTGQ